jgi:hypothetical protein
VTNKSNRENRQHKRLPKNCEVEFYSNDKIYRGTSSNFSIDGLFIRTDNPLAPGTVISMIVHLPDGPASKLTGRVRRVSRMSDSTVIDKSVMSLEEGMGIEIMKRDSHYIKFFMSLLGSLKSSSP